MAIALSALGVAFAALCVWLAVRIVNRRERWAKWTLAGTIALPLLYVLSFGPACRYLACHLDQLDNAEIVTASDSVILLYGPLGRLTANGPLFLRTPIRWYLAAWLKDLYPNSEGQQYVLPLGNDGYGVFRD